MANSLPVDPQSCAVDGGYSDPYLFAEPDDLWARTLKEDLNAAQGNRYVDAELERNEGREAEGDG